MLAGLENTALMASWGAAMPTPPMAREMGPTPMRLSPLVAWERVGAITRATRARIKETSRIAITVYLLYIKPYPRMLFYYLKLSTNNFFEIYYG